MKLIIQNKDNKFPKEFIEYLPIYMLDELNSMFSSSRCKHMTSFLKLNILSIFRYALENLNISKSGDSYILSINKNLRYNKYNLNSLINFISYGNRNLKGYRLLYIIFEETSKFIDVIYERWKNGS